MRNSTLNILSAFITVATALSIISFNLLQQKDVEPQFTSEALIQFRDEEEFYKYIESRDSFVQPRIRGDEIHFSGEYPPRPEIEANQFRWNQLETFTDSTPNVATNDTHIFTATRGTNIGSPNSTKFYVGSLPMVPGENITMLSELSLESEIESDIQLHLSGDKLVIATMSNIYGYDVSDPAQPMRIWRHSATSSFIKTYADSDSDFITLIARGSNLSDCEISTSETVDTLPCTDTYHVPGQSNTSIVTVSNLNVDDGSLRDGFSYMSSTTALFTDYADNHLYLTYQMNRDYLKILGEFVNENEDIFTPRVASLIDRLNESDMEYSRKEAEFDSVILSYLEIIGSRDRVNLEKTIENRFYEFMNGKYRQIEKTGIIKLDTTNLSLTANNSLPGQIIRDDFIYEHEGTTAVVTHINRNLHFPIYYSLRDLPQDHFDLYTFDSDFNLVNQVKDVAKSGYLHGFAYLDNILYISTEMLISHAVDIETGDKARQYNYWLTYEILHADRISEDRALFAQDDVLGEDVTRITLVETSRQQYLNVKDTVTLPTTGSTIYEGFEIVRRGNILILIQQGNATHLYKIDSDKINYISEFNAEASAVAIIGDNTYVFGTYSWIPLR